MSDPFNFPDCSDLPDWLLEFNCDVWTLDIWEFCIALIFYSPVTLLNISTRFTRLFRDESIEESFSVKSNKP